MTHSLRLVGNVVHDEYGPIRLLESRVIVVDSAAGFIVQTAYPPCLGQMYLNVDDEWVDVLADAHRHGSENEALRSVNRAMQSRMLQAQEDDR